MRIATMLPSTNVRHAVHTGLTNRNQAGISLVELLVASAIGVFLTGGAMLVYVESRDAVQVGESLARMQEHARFALTTLEPDVRAANYWGMHHTGAVIEGRASDVSPLNVTIAGDCESDFSLDVETPVGGANGAVPDTWACLTSDEHQPLSDVLIIRRAAQATVDAANLDDGRIYVRTDETPRGVLFTGLEPTGFSPFAENHALISHVYYVRPWTFTNASGQPDGVPSLRRKVLGRSGGEPRLVDEEVIPGVEDMQIQFGVDTDGDEAANLYVNPDNQKVLETEGMEVVAVRLWLMMRAERTETGFADDDQYAYADVVREPGTDTFPVGHQASAGAPDHRDPKSVNRTAHLTIRTN